MSEVVDTLVFTQFNILTGFGGYFTLNIPFFCQECGNCCRATSFPSPDQFNSLIQSLNINPALLSDSISEETIPDQSGQLPALNQVKPCVFLQNSSCQIYPHRPNYCREWFPRRAINCGGLDLHMRMSNALLQDRNYQVGIREVIYLGEKTFHSSLIPYPHVRCLEEITKATLRRYQTTSEEKIRPFWDCFLSFRPSLLEKQIFLALNPSLKNIISY